MQSESVAGSFDSNDGGVEEAFRGGVDDQQSVAPRAGQDPAARRGRVRAGGRPLGRRPQHPLARTEPARGGAQADATTKVRRLSVASLGNRTVARRREAEPAPMLRKIEADAGLTASCPLSRLATGSFELLRALEKRPELMDSLPDTTLRRGLGSRRLKSVAGSCRAFWNSATPRGT